MRNLLTFVFSLVLGVQSVHATVADADGITSQAMQRISAKMKTLKHIDTAMPETTTDWLLDNSAAKAGVFAGNDGKTLIISNGLVSRIFIVTPNLATLDIVNQMTVENMLRAVSGEGEIVIDGDKWNIGGLQGQPERGYINPEWIKTMTAMPKSFVLEDFDICDTVEVLPWKRVRWALNNDNPKGKALTFTLRGRGTTKDIVIRLTYDIYDHVPVIRKTMRVAKEGGGSVVVNSFLLEKLFFSEAEQNSNLYMPNIHVESSYTCGGTFWHQLCEKTVHWVRDTLYTSQCDYGLKLNCTLEVKTDIGPEQELSKDNPFVSYSVCEMPFDSYDRERRGLFLRRFYTTLLPWVTQNPIFLHLTSTDEAIVKRAVDQCAETGYEMIILSFGSGMDAETTDQKHIDYIKSLVEYAHGKGIEMGGYSLLASRWISDEVDVINPQTGKRGGAVFGSAPCLGSEWGQDYLKKIRSFWQQTGLTLLEHDGSYPGDVCASTSHPFHKGLKDSQWKQFKYVTDLYHWCLANGISLNVPDFYFMNGSTKVGIGYRETNWSLPRDRQLIHGRQINYTGTYERPASATWTFVPLTEYQGGGAAATLEPLSEHLAQYKQHMVQNYGAGVQACYRGPRLYDTEETKQMVTDVINWYKKYRDILNSDIIHIKKADGRDWDGFIHVNPSLDTKGLALFFNPLNHDIERNVIVPLYYTGLDDKVKVSEHDTKARTYRLDKQQRIIMHIKIPANGYTWFTFR